MSALGTRVYDACYLSGEFVLRSGKVSDEYFDKYLFESDPACCAGSPKPWWACCPRRRKCWRAWRWAAYLS